MRFKVFVTSPAGAFIVSLIFRGIGLYLGSVFLGTGTFGAGAIGDGALWVIIFGSGMGTGDSGGTFGGYIFCRGMGTSDSGVSTGSRDPSPWGIAGSSTGYTWRQPPVPSIKAAYSGYLRRHGNHGRRARRMAGALRVGEGCSHVCGAAGVTDCYLV